MSIFGGRKAIFYIKRQGLEVYLAGKARLTLTFSPETVKAEEIIDEEKLRSQLSEFLAGNNLTKLQAVVVLGEELVFQKNILGKTTEELKVEQEKFLSEIPFPNEKIVSKIYSDKKLIVAVNGEVYSLLQNEIEKSKGGMMCVVPQTLLGFPVMDEETAKRVLRSIKLLKRLNLTDAEMKTDKAGLRWPLLIVFIILLVGGGGWLYYTKVMNKPEKSVTVMDTPKETVPTETTEVTTVQHKAKNELTFRVLNGSGVAGEAGKVKTALEDLGFSNIETGNAPGDIVSVSTVSFSPEVASEERNSIKAGLMELLGEIKQVETDTNEMDVLIVTGG